MFGTEVQFSSCAVNKLNAPNPICTQWDIISAPRGFHWQHTGNVSYSYVTKSTIRPTRQSKRCVEVLSTAAKPFVCLRTNHFEKTCDKQWPLTLPVSFVLNLHTVCLYCVFMFLCACSFSILGSGYTYRVRGVDGSCAKHLAVESYTVVMLQHSYLLLLVFHHPSLLHSRLKTVLFCKSFPP